MFTELKDRLLWFDGHSSVPNDTVEQFAHYDNIHVDELTDDIRQYNRLVPRAKRIVVKTELEPFDHLKSDWNIPDSYKQLNPLEYALEILETSNECSKDERMQRVIEEYRLYVKYNLVDVLRTLIFIINRFESEQVVWGVGRGSSVSSYFLYVIGVHDVDSYLFDLDITEFLN